MCTSLLLLLLAVLSVLRAAFSVTFVLLLFACLAALVAATAIGASAIGRTVMLPVDEQQQQTPRWNTQSSDNISAPDRCAGGSNVQAAYKNMKCEQLSRDYNQFNTALVCYREHLATAHEVASEMACNHLV